MRQHCINRDVYWLTFIQSGNVAKSTVSKASIQFFMGYSIFARLNKTVHIKIKRFFSNEKPYNAAMRNFNFSQMLDYFIFALAGNVAAKFQFFMFQLKQTTGSSSLLLLNLQTILFAFLRVAVFLHDVAILHALVAH